MTLDAGSAIRYQRYFFVAATVKLSAALNVVVKTWRGSYQVPT